jgi:hypothetical protein
MKRIEDRPTEIYYCDVCGVLMGGDINYNVCSLCSKHICSAHARFGWEEGESLCPDCRELTYDQYVAECTRQAEEQRAKFKREHPNGIECPHTNIHMKDGYPTCSGCGKPVNVREWTMKGMGINDPY